MNPRPPLKGDEMYEDRVEKGMQFLDGWYDGQSWVLDLDLGVLDLKSGCDCVLGQLNGDYDTMCDILDIEEEDAIDLGFSLDYHAPHSEARNPCNWDILTEEWRTTIKDRLDQGIKL